MAAPPEKTITHLNGVWVMNRTLSDDSEPILALQGISWLIRKAISFATVTLTINQYQKAAASTSTSTTTTTTDTDTDTSTTIIDINQSASGLPSGRERRTLDWTWRPHEDRIFGKVKGRSRWVRAQDLEEEKGEEDREYLAGGWLDENGGKLVFSVAVNEEAGWEAVQTWGFEEIEGKRYYARHVVARKGGETKRARLVYDFQGD